MVNRVKSGIWSKVAVTSMLEFMVMTQGPEPEQAPDQPVKVQPELAEAVTVAWEPEE